MEKLMKLKGAVAAIRFKENGELVAYKGQMSQDLAKIIATASAANSLTAKVEGEALTKISGLKCSPLLGWAIAAGDYVLCVAGEYGVLVKISEADLNEMFKTLKEVAGI